MPCCQDSDLLSQIADVSNIITAVAGVVLAFYIFVYQRNKDALNNRLQWFKDLIIEPNKDDLYEFFNSVESISKGFNSSQLTDIRKAQLLDEIKAECALFRRNFIMLLRPVDKKMEEDILKSIDFMLDSITTASFDPNVNLADNTEFDSKILLVISKVRNYIFSRFFKYEGHN